jgi:NAD(P)H-quinone oxidoreductase subunit 5
MPTASIATLFHVDPLALIMMTLVGFIGLTVASFAARYLQGDRRYGQFFTLLALLVGSVMVMVSADHILVLLVAWGVSNLLLVKLMVHKASWKAAKASGVLAGKTYLIGFALIAAALGLLYSATGQTSIQAILHTMQDSPSLMAARVLLIGGAMTQSAIWPFHRWLLSSLNSPTPVSAMMHAGLVNGGGFLLARFAPLYFNTPSLLVVIFIVGVATALIGTLWKLMQHDVKRMLACSTMGQMGFMLAQCGLGLFPAAVAHLCWHGLFKGYLFLASGSTAQEKRLDLGYPPSAISFISAIICGMAGSYSFALASHKTWVATDTTLVLLAIALLAGSQFALPMLRLKPFALLPLAFMATAVMGGLYGASVALLETVLAPLNLMQPQPLHGFHLIGIALLLAAWLSVLFVRQPNRPRRLPEWLLRLYVWALNASQPHPATITTHRNDYKYN